MRRSLALAVFLAALLPQVGQAADTMVFTSNRAGVVELWTSGPAGVSQLTFNGMQERMPVWSPDGSAIAFAGLSAGNWDIYTISSNGEDLERLTGLNSKDPRCIRAPLLIQHKGSRRHRKLQFPKPVLDIHKHVLQAAITHHEVLCLGLALLLTVRV